MLTVRERERTAPTLRPPAPAREPPARAEAPTPRRGRGWVWFAYVVLAIAAATVAWVLVSEFFGEEGGEIAVTQEWLPEYEVDSPAPAFTFDPGPGFFVGADANLDPDFAWMQAEYEVDTPAVSYEPLPELSFWVGEDAGLD